jgi:hypothetical protein
VAVKVKPVNMGAERRPVIYVTFAYDDPDHAPVLDVSGSIEEARTQGNSGAYCYRLIRVAAGTYDVEYLVEVLP